MYFSGSWTDRRKCPNSYVDSGRERFMFLSLEKVTNIELIALSKIRIFEVPITHSGSRRMNLGKLDFFVKYYSYSRDQNITHGY